MDKDDPVAVALLVIAGANASPHTRPAASVSTAMGTSQGNTRELKV